MSKPEMSVNAVRGDRMARSLTTDQDDSPSWSNQMWSLKSLLSRAIAGHNRNQAVAFVVEVGALPWSLELSSILHVVKGSLKTTLKFRTSGRAVARYPETVHVPGETVVAS